MIRIEWRSTNCRISAGADLVGKVVSGSARGPVAMATPICFSP